MIVGTEKVSARSGGVRRRDAAVLATADAQRRMERWSPRGALWRNLARRTMAREPEDAQKKARQKKHGNLPTILSRWDASESYRDCQIGWTEKDLMLYDRIALEKHINVATRAERIQNSKHWILTLNKEGAQQPLHQRPDFAQAKRECKRLHDEHLARTQEDSRTIPRCQQVRQRKEQQFEEIEEFDCAVDPEAGWRFYKESRGNLPTASSSSTDWDRNNWKTSNWDSQHSSRPDEL